MMMMRMVMIDKRSSVPWVRKKKVPEQDEAETFRSPRLRRQPRLMTDHHRLPKRYCRLIGSSAAHD